MSSSNCLSPCTGTYSTYCESYTSQPRSSTPATLSRTNPLTDWYFFLHCMRGDLPWIATLPLYLPTLDARLSLPSDSRTTKESHVLLGVSTTSTKTVLETYPAKSFSKLEWTLSTQTTSASTTSAWNLCFQLSCIIMENSSHKTKKSHNC